MPNSDHLKPLFTKNIIVVSETIQRAGIIPDKNDPFFEKTDLNFLKLKLR